MRLSRLGVLIAVLGLMVGFVLAGPASADDASPCPPGQPSGRPPGQSPQQPGQPNGRPPSYPVGECNLKLSRGSVARGESVQVTGSGFAPGEVVTLSLGSRAVGTVRADSAGAFVYDLVVPNDAALGQTNVLATGANRELSAVLEVTAGAPASRGSATRTHAATAGLLSRTGFDSDVAGLAGVLLVCLGVVLTIAARRRRLLPQG